MNHGPQMAGQTSRPLNITQTKDSEPKPSGYIDAYLDALHARIRELEELTQILEHRTSWFRVPGSGKCPVPPDGESPSMSAAAMTIHLVVDKIAGVNSRLEDIANAVDTNLTP